MTNDPTSDLRAWIVDNLFNGSAPADFDDERDLIADGIMDSLAIMSTIAHLEAEHQITIDPGDIVPKNFVSVRTLTEFIHARAG